MRKLILKMSMSTDGFVGSPNGEIDWIFRSDDPGATSWTLDALGQAGVHIMGRRTFYDMVSYLAILQQRICGSDERHSKNRVFNSASRTSG